MKKETTGKKEVTGKKEAAERKEIAAKGRQAYEKELGSLAAGSAGTAASLLAGSGFAAYFVGGCVRDILRGKHPADIDMTTDAAPQTVRELFESGGYPTFATGLKHGTVTVLIENEPIEITTYRVDGEYADHRRPRQVQFTSRVEDDLARRDFTYDQRDGVVAR